MTYRDKYMRTHTILNMTNFRITTTKYYKIIMIKIDYDYRME